MEVLLDRCPDIDAVFAASDLMAAGALAALHAAGRESPRSRHRRLRRLDHRPVDPPALSSVRQSMEERVANSPTCCCSESSGLTSVPLLQVCSTSTLIRPSG